MSKILNINSSAYSTYITLGYLCEDSIYDLTVTDLFGNHILRIDDIVSNGGQNKVTISPLPKDGIYIILLENELKVIDFKKFTTAL